MLWVVESNLGNILGPCAFLFFPQFDFDSEPQSLPGAVDLLERLELT